MEISEVLSEPFNLEALDEVSSLSAVHLEPVLARHDDVVRLMKENLGVGGDTINELVSQRLRTCYGYVERKWRLRQEHPIRIPGFRNRLSIPNTRLSSARPMESAHRPRCPLSP
jgi:hypothetical protein